MSRALTAVLVGILVIACSGNGPTAQPTLAPASSVASAAPSASPAGATALATPASPAPASPAATAAATSVAATEVPPTVVPATAEPTAASPSDTPAPSGQVVELIAGGGDQPPANGVLATDAALQRTSGAAAAPDGTIWITDVNLSLLLHIGSDGTLADLTTTLTGPEGLSVADDGTVYVADRGGYRVVSTTGGGAVDRVAGQEFNAGFRGDGQQARRSLLFQPYDVAVASNGDIYIADSANHRIRMIDGATGIIDTIVGTGEPGFSGDDGPATEAQIYAPQAIALDEANSRLLIADTTNQRLRHVDLTTSVITTISGTGTSAVSYDPNLTGTQTPITRIAALATDVDGNAYFTVFWGDVGNVIMRLAPDGTLTRVIGGGDTAAPGVTASEFALPDVLGLAIDPFTGSLLICGSDGKVWRLADVVGEQ